MHEDLEDLLQIGYLYLLREDEGIVVEYQNKLFIIWKNSASTLSVEQIRKESLSADEINNMPPGSKIWMHNIGFEN